MAPSEESKSDRHAHHHRLVAASITSFITSFNNHDLNGVMSTFCQDDTTTNPNAPCVGITDHGPSFILRARRDSAIPATFHFSESELTALE
jgi:hypothetical protein